MTYNSVNSKKWDKSLCVWRWEAEFQGVKCADLTHMQLEISP